FLGSVPDHVGGRRQQEDLAQFARILRMAIAAKDEVGRKNAQGEYNRLRSAEERAEAAFMWWSDVSIARNALFAAIRGYALRLAKFVRDRAAAFMDASIPKLMFYDDDPDHVWVELAGSE